jgi:hypothetical protein
MFMGIWKKSGNASRSEGFGVQCSLSLVSHQRRLNNAWLRGRPSITMTVVNTSVAHLFFILY